ncbi:MAG: helix-turn-helix transcriptional regulator [Lachnospiraceae bacterium]|nr:helix-turn-helix transcriptional regulator [Lachnospiraceae bacterium]
MGKNFRETLNKQLVNPEFKAEWDALEPEYQVIQAMLQGRKEHNLTQKQLAEKTGITQADISRLENGESNPSLSTLKRLAEGLGMRLKLEFVPMTDLSLTSAKK